MSCRVCGGRPVGCGHAVVISVGEGNPKNQTGRQADKVKEVEGRIHLQHLQHAGRKRKVAEL